MPTSDLDPLLDELIADAHWLRASVERFSRPRHFTEDEMANRSVGDELADSLGLPPEALAAREGIARGGAGRS